MNAQKRILGLEGTKIVKFFRDNFDSVIHEEQDSLELAFNRGETLYIIGFDGKGESHHIVAAIMYVSCAKGSYINWFAVSQRNYDTSRFGKNANGQPFCNMGLGSFLLQMVQLQAVAQGYKCDLYLQANMATRAAEYYQHQGFVTTDTNEAKHLPETLLTWCKQAKLEKSTTPFVYFVTDEVLIQDAICNKTDPDAPKI